MNALNVLFTYGPLFTVVYISGIFYMSSLWPNANASYINLKTFN